MATTRWNFPNGSDGTTLTPVLAGADTATLTGGTAILSDDQLLTGLGPLSAKMTSTVSGHLWWAKESLTATAYAMDVYVYMTVAHATQSYLMWAGTGSASRSCGVAFASATRTLRLIDQPGTTRWESTAVPLNTWVRISIYVTCSATVGTAQLAWYLGHDTTPQQTSGTVTGLNTLASIDRIRVGIKAASSTSTSGEGFIGSWAYDPVATGLIPPVSVPPPADPVSVWSGMDEVTSIYVDAGDWASRVYVGDTQVWPSTAGTLWLTTTGTTFSPQVELKIGSTASVDWISTGATVTGTDLLPTLTWSGSGPHQVALTVSKRADLTTVNLGFDHLDDEGQYTVGAAYDRAPQPVTKVIGLQRFSGLKRFLAANGPLTGHLDFTGCAVLEFIECFEAQVQSVDLTGCVALKRLCLESNQLTTLDLNPCKDSLFDLRAANMQGGTLTFTTLGGDGKIDNLYHFCVRTQDIINAPTLAQLPMIEQWWVWDAGIVDSGTPTSTRLNSPQAHSNGLDQAEVDALLVYINANVPNAVGNVRLEGNAAPSATGIAAKNALIARGGWSVTTS